MVALAEDEALLSKLFQHRFSGGKGLDGHSFGNLFLTALTAVSGDFQQAVQLSSEVLAIRGSHLRWSVKGYGELFSTTRAQEFEGICSV